MLFRVLDYTQTPVIFSSQTWRKLLDPIFGHPEIKSYRAQIRKTLMQPDYVYQSLRGARTKLFFTKLATGSFASYYLVIMVKYVKEQIQTVGYVSTAMINRKLPTHSKLLWQRKHST